MHVVRTHVVCVAIHTVSYCYMYIHVHVYIYMTVYIIIITDDGSITKKHV